MGASKHSLGVWWLWWQLGGSESHEGKGSFLFPSPRTFPTPQGTLVGLLLDVLWWVSFVVPTVLVTGGQQSSGGAQTHISAAKNKSRLFPTGHQWVFLGQKWPQSLHLGDRTPPWGQRESSDLRNLRPSCGWGPHRCKRSSCAGTWSFSTGGSGRTETSQLVARAPPASSRHGAAVWGV